MKKTFKVALHVALIVSIILLSLFIIDYYDTENSSSQPFFFGVTCGSTKVDEIKLLIDRVKEYSNLFVINSWDIALNETALTEVCEYAINSKLSIIDLSFN
jgi:hypothetical protein